MMVVVEGRKPQCWNCKQLGHFSKSCPQKTAQQGTATTATIAAAAAATAAVATTATKEITTAAVSEGPNPETGGHPDKGEGWTQVQRGKKKKNPTKTANAITATTAVTTMATTTSTANEKQPASSATTKQQPVKQQQPTSSSTTTKKSQGKNKDKNNKETEGMEVSVNLKRRRDSGDSQKDGGEKKHIKKHPKTTKYIPKHHPSLNLRGRK